MKYYITAGEASGDLHASNLMKAIKTLDLQAEFRFWGGDLMKEQGGSIVKHYKETSYMGFVEVFRNLGNVKKNFKLFQEDILKYQPDVFIPVDYPGFNLRMSKFVHELGIPVHYYISPKVWAWNTKRVYKIKQYVDKLFAIFPFEIDFYKTYDYTVEYVGNPLLDAIEDELKNDFSETEFRQKHNLSDKPIIAILAGSRKSEIKNNLPSMLEVSKLFPEYQFVMAAAPSLDLSLYDQYTKGYDLKIVYNQTYNVLKIAKAALITSGTATLEATLLNTPLVCCYRGDNLSYHIAKRLVKVNYLALTNLILDKPAIKELIQFEMTPENMAAELKKLLTDSQHRQTLFADFDKTRQVLGGIGASRRTAEIIYQTLNRK